MSKNIGKHVAHIEGDTLFLTLDGSISLEQAEEMLALAEAIIVATGRYFGLHDVTHLGGVPSEVRRRIADWSRSRPISGVAAFGASLPTRAVGTLLLRAMGILRPQAFASLFARGETEAREWIAARRRKLIQAECGKASEVC